jgi:energy-coupling factor transporter ATP-binding protein EcfA2
VSDRVSFTLVEFRNFKAFERFSVTLQDMNVLVGPNNSGKSTVIGAFRALAVALRRARAKSPERVTVGEQEHLGYHVPADGIPISLENVHTDYCDLDSSVVFRLSNKNRLRLHFPREGGCIMVTDTEGPTPRSPSSFRNAFPVTIGVVPVLGPVEHEEPLLNVETVTRNLATHRASRHFRNYWYQFPDGFDEYARLISATWTGMEIEPPVLIDTMNPKLSMFCRENRIARELYWAGFGFQVWCQLLTHIYRSQQDSLLIVDEPEIYLHPEVQRHLLAIFRDAAPDVLLATHSTEIMSEADPAELVLVDKAKRAANRLRDVQGVQAALALVGSVQNITLTQLAKSRRVLFTQGSTDMKLIRRFARVLGLSDVASGANLAVVDAGGFSTWERVKAVAWGIERTIGTELQIAAVFDRDFRCDNECDAILNELKQHLAFAHIHARKEIENYLLVPDVLTRAVARAIADRQRRSGETIEDPEPIPVVLGRLSEPLRNEVQGQYVAKYTQYHRGSGKDHATLVSEAIAWFEPRWMDINSRMEVIPGKQILHGVRQTLQDTCGVTLTDFRIIDEFRPAEVPKDLQTLLRRLDRYTLWAESMPQ